LTESGSSDYRFSFESGYQLKASNYHFEDICYLYKQGRNL